MSCEVRSLSAILKPADPFHARTARAVEARNVARRGSHGRAGISGRFGPRRPGQGAVALWVDPCCSRTRRADATRAGRPALPWDGIASPEKPGPEQPWLRSGLGTLALREDHCAETSDGPYAATYWNALIQQAWMTEIRKKGSNIYGPVSSGQKDLTPSTRILDADMSRISEDLWPAIAGIRSGEAQTTTTNENASSFRKKLVRAVEMLYNVLANDDIETSILDGNSTRIANEVRRSAGLSDDIGSDVQPHTLASQAVAKAAAAASNLEHTHRFQAACQSVELKGKQRAALPPHEVIRRVFCLRIDVAHSASATVVAGSNSGSYDLSDRMG
jgi:hypothetical protein